MLSFVRSFAPVSILVLVACSSSNFDVASGNGGDSSPGNDDTAQGADSTSVDSSTDDTSLLDVPSPGDVIGEGIVDAVSVDASTCPGTTCPSTTGGAVCVDLATDPRNCGACEKAVCHGEYCVGGSPRCVPGFKPCAAAGTGCLGCKDFANDILNCGSCGKACVVGEYCIDGTCTTGSLCPSSTKLCGPESGPAGCVDTDNDRNNCGDCAKACAPDEYCAKGTCVQYTSAPGCSVCPCGTCSGKFSRCCQYGGDVVCATSDCPAG